MNRFIGADLYRALFAPQSIALIGASDDANKTAGRPLAFLRQWSYAGRVYAVNSARDSVQGVPAWPTVAALPEVPEHAYLLLPTDAVLQAAEECARAGVPVISILASGFSESGDEGRQREQQLRALAARSGMRILGPSSLGLVNTGKRLVLSANAAFAEPGLPEGGMFLASQSGSMLGALASRARERGLGFAGMVSVGGECDLSLGEICEASLGDARITSYLLFLESLRDAARLRAFALAAARVGKPVLAYKLGRSKAAAELAQSHTGALAGEDAVADAFLRDCGIARLHTLEGFLEAAPLLRALPVQRRPLQVGIVTTTGGGAAMLVDQLSLGGVEVQAASDATHERLASAGVTAQRGRILDLTMAGTRREVMLAALDVMSCAPEFDLVMVVIGSSARHFPERAVEPVIAMHQAGRRVAAFLVPDAQAALRMLSEAGVPCFRNPESCADAVAAASGRRGPRETNAALTSIVQAGALLDEWESSRLLESQGLRFAPGRALDVRESLPSSGIEYPAVAKVLSSQLPHKSDVGGVVLGIDNPSSLAAAVAQIQRKVAQAVPDVSVERVLVQSMLRGVGEMLIGYRVDPEVGPIVLAAMGGVAAELLNQKAIRLAPVDEATAHEMLRELPGLALLQAHRGGKRGDLQAVARAIVALSRLALPGAPAVVEAEINPLLVREEGEGAVGLDAVVRMAATAS